MIKPIIIEQCSNKTRTIIESEPDKFILKMIICVVLVIWFVIGKAIRMTLKNGRWSAGLLIMTFA